MNVQVEQGLARLTSVLPLQASQTALDAADARLHRAILHGFAEKGRFLNDAEMSGLVSDVERSVKRLAELDVIVLDGVGKPLGAYPFTEAQREHRVSLNGHTVHAMCAMDALSVAPMFGLKTSVDSVCAVTGKPLHVEQDGMSLLNRDALGELCFGIAWSASSGSCSCAESLCLQMLFLADRAVAQRWLAEDPGGREIYALDDAIAFGARFFSPLLV